ncbi:hypothetical protein [Microbispora sp. GKU 823]|uniref:hypothetical protein n=1 Tax=Microbispora sp. GKU 823 TaxID=1652100 RepID=UPI0009A2E7AD|nr:hypothetical protein [Microbispora sp. GKU 823]OPG13641.1 hypothetical protein B1L11_06550 [Microbispora sp. GKU 823]
MSTADRVAELRAQADALEALAGLEADLAEAKAAYDANPNEETKAARDQAMQALRDARALTRTDGVSVGGDAYQVEED